MRANQSILKEISPGISLEGMMLKLKLQYFGHLMRKVDSLETTLMLGGIGGRRRRGRQRMRWLGGIPDSMDVSLSELRELWWTGRPGVLWFMGSQRIGHDWATELNWVHYIRTLLDTGFPDGSVSKESACQARQAGSVSESGRSPGERKWQSTLVFLPGKSYGQRSLTGYSSRGCKELDATEQLTLHILFLPLPVPK